MGPHAGRHGGEVVASGVVVSSAAGEQAPKVAAKPSINAKPRIFVFITPLSQIMVRTIFNLLNKIPYLLDFFFKFFDGQL